MYYIFSFILSMIIILSSSTKITNMETNHNNLRNMKYKNYGEILSMDNMDDDLIEEDDYEYIGGRTEVNLDDFNF